MVNSEEVQSKNLSALLSDIYYFRPERILYLSADSDVHFQNVAEIVDVVQNLQFHHLDPEPSALKHVRPMRVELRLVTDGSIGKKCPSDCFNWVKEPLSLFRDAERRTLKGVADSLNCSVQNVFWWSARHAWKSRCDASDLWLDQQQRPEFARHRVRTRTRHLTVAQAMLNVAAHGIKEWQAKIASGAELNLTPEQVALLVKSSAELERNTIGMDGENRPAVINVLFGMQKYDDEKAGERGEISNELEWKSMEDIERAEYEKLNDDERRAWESWKDPPKKLTK